jgi:hypothetical protein
MFSLIPAIGPKRSLIPIVKRTAINQGKRPKVQLVEEKSIA